MNVVRGRDVTISDRVLIALPIVVTLLVTAAPIVGMMAGMHKDVASLVDTVKAVVIRTEAHGDRITRLEAQR